jgi:hypothetical protein
VLSLSKAGYGAQAKPAVDWLAANAGSWTEGKSGTDAAATATLILAAEAAGQNPHSFAGTDLVTRLTAAGPAAPSTPASPTPAKHTGSSGGISPLWVIGVGLLIGVGFGVLLSMRKRKS